MSPPWVSFFLGVSSILAFLWNFETHLGVCGLSPGDQLQALGWSLMRSLPSLRCSLEGLCRQAYPTYLLNWETEARKFVKCLSASPPPLGAPWASSRLRWQLSALSHCGPLPRDWIVCLSAALLILLLCERAGWRKSSSWQTAKPADSFSHLCTCVPDLCLAALPA